MAVSKGDSTRTRTSFPQPRRAQGVISARKRHAEPEAGHPLEPIAKRRIETAPQHAPAGGGGGGAAGGVERAMRRGKKVRFDPVVEEFGSRVGMARGKGGAFRQPATTTTTTTTRRLAKPRARKGCWSDKRRVEDGRAATQSFPSQPQTPIGYFPFLASSPRKETEWKPDEDNYLLDAAKRREGFPVTSTTLARSEQGCRDRVAHLVKVLQSQLAGPSMALDEELLHEMKQEAAQRSRISGENRISESEHQLGSEEEQEDDDFMKLVIWKVYQRDGVLDTAVMENHQGLKEELNAIEWICPQLLELAANIFIKRRAETNGKGYRVVETWFTNKSRNLSGDRFG